MSAPKKMGRPRIEPTREEILSKIDTQYRSFFEGLGLRGQQVMDGLDYIHRGFTMRAAARLVIAGITQANQEENAA